MTPRIIQILVGVLNSPDECDDTKCEAARLIRRLRDR